jgi:SAM-dependent methyltransferase
MHERVIDLYDRNAAAWDRQRGRELVERPWLERFVGLLPEGGGVLDVGCGTAEPIGRYLIEGGFSLTGIDASPAMIEVCRGRLPRAEWVVADMRELSLGRRFDGLIAWHSFFHLRPADQRPVLQRFAEHLSPGGALMFTSGPAHGESMGQWHGEPLYHGSLDPEEYRTLLERNGLTVVAHRPRDPDCGDATVWIARAQRP